MSCSNCGTPTIGNEVYGLHYKMGHPFSSAAERNVINGGIPQVIRFPGFTLVAGGVITNKMSNAGIRNQSSFFKTRTGVYFDNKARLAGCCANPA